MARRSVEIVISANDQASAKVVNAARNIENANKKIEQTGKRSKAANEALAQFASLLGAGGLGGASGALTSIGDKFGEIGDDIQAAKFQALALKTVIVGGLAAGVITVGQLIAQHFLDQLEEANKQAERLNQMLQQDAEERLQSTLEQVQSIAAEEERRIAAQEALVGLAQREAAQKQIIAQAEERIAQLRNFNPRGDIGQLGNAVLNIGMSMTGQRGQLIEQLEAERDAAQAALDAQREAIIELTQLSENRHQSDLERIEEKRQAEAEAAKERLEALRKQQEEEAKAAQKAREREMRLLDQRRKQATSALNRIDDQLESRQERQPQDSNPAEMSRLLSRVRTDDKNIERDQLAELKAQKKLLELQLEAIRKLEKEARDKLEVELVP